MIRWMILTSWVLILGFGFIIEAKAGYSDYDNYDDINYVPVVKKVVDFYSKPKYAFGYEVDGLDPYYKELSHGRWEIRDGDVTQGQYRVLLPDGRIQIVSYIADKFGYRPTIQYIDKGSLPPPPPAYANVKVPQKYIEEPIIHLPPRSVQKFHSNAFIAHVPQPPVEVHVKSVPVLPPFAQYGAGFGYGQYGGGFGYGDPYLGAGSSVSTKRVAKKRALLYDRTLFRKDVERKRRSGTKA